MWVNAAARNAPGGTHGAGGGRRSCAAMDIVSTAVQIITVLDTDGLVLEGDGPIAFNFLMHVPGSCGLDDYSQMGALRKQDLGRLATFLAGLSQFLSQRPGHGQFLISRPEMNRENTGGSARYPSRSTRLLAPRLSLHADPRGTCRALLVAPRQPPCPLRSGFCGRSRLKRPARRVHWRAA